MGHGIDDEVAGVKDGEDGGNMEGDEGGDDKADNKGVDGKEDDEVVDGKEEDENTDDDNGAVGSCAGVDVFGWKGKLSQRLIKLFN